MLIKVIFIFLVDVLFVNMAWSTEGLNIIGVGPSQQGTAGAGVSSSENSKAMILNPAGLTDIERSVDVSFQIFSPNRMINSTYSGGAGRQRDDSSFYIPSISSSFGCCFGEKGYLGLGLYGASGMGVDYNYGRVGADTNGDRLPDTPQNQVDKFTKMAIAKMILAYAYKFDNGISVGGGPLLVASRLRTDMLNNNFIAQSGKWDDAYGIGMIVGVNKKLNNQWTVGASYTSEQFMQEFKEYERLLIGSLNLPAQVTAGVSYKINSKLETLIDYRWIGWGNLDTLGDQFGWKDQHIIKIGLRWQVINKLMLRGGVSHGNSPIKSDHVFGNALFPAIIETHATCGLSYKIDAITLDAAYIHAFKNTLTESGSNGNGTKISMYQNSFTLGASWEY